MTTLGESNFGQEEGRTSGKLPDSEPVFDETTGRYTFRCGGKEVMTSWNGTPPDIESARMVQVPGPDGTKTPRDLFGFGESDGWYGKIVSGSDGVGYEFVRTEPIVAQDAPGEHVAPPPASEKRTHAGWLRGLFRGGTPQLPVGETPEDRGVKNVQIIDPYTPAKRGEDGFYKHNPVIQMNTHDMQK